MENKGDSSTETTEGKLESLENEGHILLEHKRKIFLDVLKDDPDLKKILLERKPCHRTFKDNRAEFKDSFAKDIKESQKQLETDPENLTNFAVLSALELDVAKHLADRLSRSGIYISFSGGNSRVYPEFLDFFKQWTIREVPRPAEDIYNFNALLPFELLKRVPKNVGSSEYGRPLDLFGRRSKRSEYSFYRFGSFLTNKFEEERVVIDAYRANQNEEIKKQRNLYFLVREGVNLEDPTIMKLSEMDIDLHLLAQNLGDFGK